MRKEQGAKAKMSLFESSVVILWDQVMGNKAREKWLCWGSTYALT